MPKRLMNLRNVPDDEAMEVRALLDEHGIAYYETPPGAWGISGGGIWLHEADEHPRASQLLKAYQTDRAERVRAEFEKRRQRGEVEGFWDHARRNPLKVVVFVLLSAGILMIFAAPVYQLATG